ncbi:MAG: ABC transporter permease [Solirubrobacterales bacterium]
MAVASDVAQRAEPTFGLAPARRSRWRALVRRPPALIALIVLLVMLVACYGAPLFAPHAPEQIGTGELFEGPSWQHFAGTDELGRDLFSRLLYGGRLTFTLAIAATAISMLVGVAWGFSAAHAGRWRDGALMRPADVLMAIPPILFALVLVAAFGTSISTLTIIVGLLLAPPTARIARSAVLRELSSDYRLAAIAAGASSQRILWRELLPNTMPTLIAQATLNAAGAIFIEASLSFIGLGVEPPTASWGTLVQYGYRNLASTTTYVLYPALCIVVAVWALNVLADELQTVLDPRSGR